MKAFALAARLLTILPAPGAPEEPDPDALAASVARFPLVGLALGALLVVLDAVLGAFLPEAARAGVLVVSLAALTGGLHLDGLSDLADGVGGGADPESRLRIMKDSACGPMGVMAIASVLLLKFAALLSLPEEGRWSALFLAPTLGRAAMAHVLTSLPYARPEGGTGEAFAGAASPAEGYAAIGWAGAASLLLGFGGGVLVAFLAALLTLGLVRFLNRMLEGATGDAYGAVCEIVETAALLMFAAWWGA
ncbi:MAG: adenosylcobinamide-GDP ribazoletransferase [bacterium]